VEEQRRVDSRKRENEKFWSTFTRGGE